MKIKESVETIILSPTKHKKYRAILVDKSTGKIRVLDFGDNRYEQYRDSTKNRAYSHLDHLDRARRLNYYKRHSNVSHKNAALAIEFRKSRGYYTPKILSHKFLW